MINSDTSTFEVAAQARVAAAKAVEIRSKPLRITHVDGNYVSTSG